MKDSIIDVKKLVRKFGDFIAVDEISFNVFKGEIFAFLGPNGAGKSTTIKMLTTLLHPTSGEIYIDNKNVNSEKDKVRNSFAIVFQDQSLDDELTAYENMDFHGVLYKVPKNIRKERIIELLNIVGLWEKKDQLVKNFSGGMKRRLEIARGLLHHPKVFFLDEPTLGLDPQTRNQIWEYIHKLNKEEKVTIFFTTHYMEEAAKMADRIAIIDNGKILVIGNLKELLNKTKTSNLEDAFLKLTGKEIREEEVNSSLNKMKMRHQLRR